MLQPPSGGCVLKHKWEMDYKTLLEAATFGWLCVETNVKNLFESNLGAATFGWLCVETTSSNE